MKVVVSFMLVVLSLFWTESIVVCGVQVVNPALSVIALYSENADEVEHPDLEQVMNLKLLSLMVEVGGIHMSSTVVLNFLMPLDFLV